MTLHHSSGRHVRASLLSIRCWCLAKEEENSAPIHLSPLPHGGDLVTYSVPVRSILRVCIMKMMKMPHTHIWAFVHCDYSSPAWLLVFPGINNHLVLLFDSNIVYKLSKAFLNAVHCLHSNHPHLTFWFMYQLVQNEFVSPQSVLLTLRAGYKEHLRKEAGKALLKSR